MRAYLHSGLVVLLAVYLLFVCCFLTSANVRAKQKMANARRRRRRRENEEARGKR